MTKEYQRAVFVFRRDYRLVDNTALLKALEKSNEVIPIFIFDPVLIDRENLNTNATQFMIESLQELNNALQEKGSQLFIFHGNPKKVVQELINEVQIDAVFCNLDYSPYSRKRDTNLTKLCESNDVDFFTYADYLLINPETVYTSSNERYQVFTYFYRKCKEKQIRVVSEESLTNYYKGKINSANPSLLEFYTPEVNKDLFVNTGRKNALKILQNIREYENYEETRDYPSKNSTTKLSAHLKFGTVSVREVYNTIKEELGKEHALIRQLFWREFYVYLSFHYDHVFKRSFKKKYDRITWDDDTDKFEKWCQGKTGFPIVDAGMRQLNSTGYMHNRVRMIVASFLVKDLHLNWQWGENYFAQKLVDYDIMVNNGNWQWAASTGADAQPYFRIFNPWTQQKKYDKDAIYIKTYVKELEDLPPEVIHNLNSQRPLDISEYPVPMVNHKKQANQAKKMFKEIV